MKRLPYRGARPRGFSLLEVMITVAIIGMLASIAIPTIRQATRVAKINRAAADLRQYTGIIQTYNLANGGYPADRYPGEMPVGMEDMMPHQWKEGTPIGGQWDWDYRQFQTTAAISIYNTSDSVEKFYLWWGLDQRLDDGNLLQGSIRIRPSGLMYVLEESS